MALIGIVTRNHMTVLYRTPQIIASHRRLFPGLQDEHMKQAEWQLSRVTELDLTSTELSADCLQNILCRAGAGFTYLGLGHCEFFNDHVSYSVGNVVV